MEDARTLKAIIAQLERRIRQLERETAGIPARWGTGGGDGLNIYRFVRHDGDCIVCNPHNVSTGTTDDSVEIFIAKPHEIRRTPFEGQTVNGISYTYTSDYERTATEGSDTEDQIILPVYVANFTLVYADTAETEEFGARKVSLIDSNKGGRVWAMDEE